MYVVIQKIMRKRPNKYGAYKELNVREFSYSINGITKIKYYHSFEGERFERPHREAYKISLHKSYRVNGKVHKQQIVITTVDYYTLIEFGLWDCIQVRRIESKLDTLGTTIEELYDMVYEKLQPIIDQITSEFKQTEEYKTKQQHNAILDQYRKAEKAFEEIYGDNTYAYCYDVYGVLRNEDYLEELKAKYKAQQEYQQRSYYQQSQSNYNNYDYSSSYQPTTLQYLESDKPMLKKIIRTLTKTYHPDVGGDPEIMKMVTRLKDEWGV